MEKETKSYILKVTIQNPEDTSELINFTFDVIYTTDKNNYGNGTYLNIKGRDAGRTDSHLYDIRYNRDYHTGHEIEFLTAWACEYWNGENGAYILKNISIETV